MIRRILILVTTLTMAACQGGSNVTGEISEQQKNATVDSLDADLVAANTDFAMRLFGEIAQSDPDKNIFVSPPSVAVALAMTYNGADNETQRAMAQTLRIEDFDLNTLNSSYAELLSLLQNPDTDVELSIANSIWARQGLPFHEDFLERNRAWYSARIEHLDFNSPSAAPTINGWVDTQTRGKIHEIVDSPLDPMLIMVLINAIYFKGTWTTEFADSLTEPRSFTLSDGTQIQHPQMSTADTLPYLETESFSSVSIPYASGRLSMYVFLPHPSSDVAAFLDQLTVENWNHWMDSYTDMEGNLRLPKFRMEYDIELKDVLSALGMAVAFDPSHADFSKLFPVSAGQNAYISKVKHKTFVDVNEQGTEAAAVTSVEIVLTGFDPNQPERFYMVVDRPFVFAIRDNQTGIVLFMGVAVDPRSES